MTFRNFMNIISLEFTFITFHLIDGFYQPDCIPIKCCLWFAHCIKSVIRSILKYRFIYSIWSEVEKKNKKCNDYCIQFDHFEHIQIMCALHYNSIYEEFGLLDSICICWLKFIKVLPNLYAMRIAIKSSLLMRLNEYYNWWYMIKAPKIICEKYNGNRENGFVCHHKKV